MANKKEIELQFLAVTTRLMALIDSISELHKMINENGKEKH